VVWRGDDSSVGFPVETTALPNAIAEGVCDGGEVPAPESFPPLPWEGGDDAQDVFVGLAERVCEGDDPAISVFFAFDDFDDRELRRLLFAVVST